MEKFKLLKYLENPNRGVITRERRKVRIICWDRKDSKYPIIGLISNENGLKEDGCCFYAVNGDAYGDACYDLFFADEEEKLTEFEKCVQNILNEPHFQDVEAVKQFSKELLNLAREELLKDLPKWKKVDSNPPKVQYNLQGKRLYKNGEYYIELSDLEALSKEE